MPNENLIRGSKPYLRNYHKIIVLAFISIGRLLCSPRWPGMRPETLTALTVTVSPDTIGVRDQADERCVHLFDTSTGKPLNDGKPFKHKQEIAEIALDQIGNILTTI